MTRWTEKVFARMGRPAVLYTAAGEETVQVIFQSINSRSWQNMDLEYNPLGKVPRGQYLCMLPAGTAAEEGDKLGLDGKKYEIRKLEKMYIGSEVQYLWGLCLERKG